MNGSEALSMEKYLKDEIYRIETCLVRQKESSCDLHHSLMDFISKDIQGEGFIHLDNRGLLKIMFPDIEGLKTVGKCKYHKEDAFCHMNMVYKKFTEFTDRKIKLKGIDLDLFKLPLNKYIQRFNNKSSGEEDTFTCEAYSALAAFAHDIGKFASYRKDGEKISFRGHDKSGAHIMKEFCKKYSFPRIAADMLITLIDGHMYPLNLFTSRMKDEEKSFNKFFDRYGLYVPFILSISLCDMYGKSMEDDDDKEKEEFKIFLEKIASAYNLYTER